MKVKVLFGFLLSFLMLNGIESTCNYFQNLETDKTYYAFNPDYPKKYEGEQQCKWQMESHYVTKINCSVDMPVLVKRIQEKESFYCQDILSIQSEGSIPKFFGTLVFEELNSIIKLDSPLSSQGGKLLCQIEENWLKICGFGTLVFEAINPIIRLDSSPSSQGGKFLCQIQDENSKAENPFDENCKCGWKKETRIVGGKETGVNEFPMMCGLVDSTMRMIYCGCTIISKQDVLTAAHCIEGRNVSNMGVVVGEHDVITGNETNATKLFRVSNCKIHPDYNNKTNENDIAVCKINGTLKYSAEVGPVCLPFQHKQDSFGGDTVTALGWGLLEFGGVKSTTLQEVDLNVIELENCSSYYPQTTDKNICTYSPRKDSCQMDSGGPLLWQNPTTRRLVLVGIISEGVGCASHVPSVGTRIKPFIPWILSVTPGVQYCMVE